MFNSTCPICYESYSNRQSRLPLALGCGHIFCNKCIDQLKQANSILRQAKCPHCLKKIDDPRRVYLEMDEDGGSGKTAATNREAIALVKKLTRDPPRDVLNEVTILTTRLETTRPAEAERIIDQGQQWIVKSVIPEKWKGLVLNILTAENGARQRLETIKTQKWEADQRLSKNKADAEIRALKVEIEALRQLWRKAVDRGNDFELRAAIQEEEIKNYKEDLEAANHRLEETATGGVRLTGGYDQAILQVQTQAGRGTRTLELLKHFFKQLQNPGSNARTLDPVSILDAFVLLVLGISLYMWLSFC